MDPIKSLTKSILVAGFLAASHLVGYGYTLSINDNVSGIKERGAAFNLTNTSTTESIVLTGVFNLPIQGTASETYKLWIRQGTVLGNIGVGATNWTSFGTATATTVTYGSPNFTLTTYTFDLSSLGAIAPGATIGIWLKDSDNTQTFTYVSGGSTNVSSTTGFTSGGSIAYTGVYGLGATGNSPLETNTLNGPTRNFIGEIGYNVIPEPSAFALLAGAGVLGLVVYRRRR